MSLGHPTLNEEARPVESMEEIGRLGWGAKIKETGNNGGLGGNDKRIASEGVYVRNGKAVVRREKVRG